MLQARSTRPRPAGLPYSRWSLLWDRAHLSNTAASPGRTRLPAPGICGNTAPAAAVAQAGGTSGSRCYAAPGAGACVSCAGSRGGQRSVAASAAGSAAAPGPSSTGRAGRELAPQAATASATESAASSEDHSAPHEQFEALLREYSQNDYRVFISHAGPQKLSFADGLWRALRRNGVNAFMDQHDLRQGDAAAQKMETAIRNADIVVFILTLDFLRSGYCMEELRWALDERQRRERQGQKPAVILTELYHSTDPAVGIDADRLPSANAVWDTVDERLRDALEGQPTQRVFPPDQQLRDLAALTDWTATMTNDGLKFDSDHTNALVAEVQLRLGLPRLTVADHPVEIDTQLAELLPLLQPKPTSVLSLWGMGGIGKSTLAVALYNERSRSFSRHIFFEAGRKATKDEPLQQLQRRLLDKLTEGGAVLPKDNSSGQLSQLQDCIERGPPLLLVLDDIWSAEQRDALLPAATMRNSKLPHGSCVVLTGRRASHLLPPSSAQIDGCRHLHKVAPLGPKAAEELLCHHAFGSAVVPYGFEAVVKAALRICGGLPLALKVVGSAMSSFEDPTDCEELPDVLVEPDGGDAEVDSVDIILRWSYDRLRDNHKCMFLDAAIMLQGRPAAHLTAAWNSLMQQRVLRPRLHRPKLRRRAGAMLTDLIDASLIQLVQWETSWPFSMRIDVHDCLVDMALNVADDAACCPKGWTLIGGTLDDCQSDCEGAQTATRLLLDASTSIASGAVRTEALANLLVRHPSLQLAAIDVDQAAKPETAPGEVPVVHPGSQLEHLVYLRVTGSPPSQNLLSTPRLAVLHVLSPSSWAKYTSLSLPRFQDFEGLPREWPGLRLPTEHCVQHLPQDLGSLTNLHTLCLSYCPMLCSVPDSIGSLTSLHTLDLKSCVSLEGLPDSISGLVSLKTLDLGSCEQLESLPDSISGLSSLQNLNLSHCRDFKGLPDGISGLTSLQTLDLIRCKRLESLPDGISGLTSLQTLHLIGCDSLTSLPDGISGLTSLQTLDLSYCKRLESLPDGIGGLDSLQTLHLTGCDSLTSLPDGISGLTSLQTLDLTSCGRLEGLPDGISGLVGLQTLRSSHCTQLEGLPDGISGLSSLQSLDLCRCANLKSLPDGISGLSSLQALNLSPCVGLKSLPDGISGLVSLPTLSLRNCLRLEGLPDSISSLVRLRSLDLTGCVSLKTLPDGISGLASLQTLDLSGCGQLEKLPDAISGLVSLQALHSSCCLRLEGLPDGISGLSSLQSLDLCYCDSLKHLPDGISGLVSLQALYVSRCGQLGGLPDGVSGLVSLQTLHLCYCQQLEGLPEGFSRLSSLQTLNLCTCENLRSLPECISGLISLQKLELSGCSRLKGLPHSMSCLTSLQSLDVSFCKTLQELPDGMSGLTYLDLGGCGMWQLPPSFTTRRFTALQSLYLPWEL